MTYCDKQSVYGKLALSALVIGDPDTTQLVLSEKLGYAAIQHKLDIISCPERLNELCLAAEGISAVYKVDLRSCVAQEHRILQGGVSAAVYGDGPALIKRTVANRAEADSGAH